MKPLKERQKLREERKKNPDIYADHPALQEGTETDESSEADDKKPATNWGGTNIKK